MPPLDYSTAGESHGPAIVAIVTGLPSGLAIDEAFINAELIRRQGGYGRGARQAIEDDRVRILSGVRRGVSIGSPLTLVVENKDARLDDLVRTPPVFRPRPGHADLAGAIKHLTNDCRPALERASARETAGRVAAGAAARLLLREFGIEVFAFTRAVLGISSDASCAPATWRALRAIRDSSETYCPDPGATARQRDAIREAKMAKDTVGGVVEAHVFGCPPGLGSCMDWRERLDARLAGAVMGIQAIKGVEIGLGFGAAARPGSLVHDPIRFDPRARESSATLGFSRDTNNAGGIEGGMTNGEPIVVRAAMKPIATLLRAMPSVDLASGAPAMSQHERSDVCAVPAASVVLENVVAFEVARCFRDKFAGDSLAETRAQVDAYLRLARDLPLEPPTATLA